jgi:glucosamine kinase
MIDYLIGADGGGTGTRVRLADAAGAELAQGASGPSGLGLGIAGAWTAIEQAITDAFTHAGLAPAPRARIALGLGLAGVHNRQWAQAFLDADPGYGAVDLETDAFTTLLGAHGGEPGAIVAIGTGSAGEALYPDGTRREVGGWGFPSGDEASGAWMGLRAICHAQQVLDGRRPGGSVADSVIAACGGHRAAIQVWLGQATQTDYASLAPLVLRHAHDPVARAILQDAGREIAATAHALDPDATLPLALCGGLGGPLAAWLPPELAARARAPLGDAAQGALHLARGAAR